MDKTSIALSIIDILYPKKKDRILKKHPEYLDKINEILHYFECENFNSLATEITERDKIITQFIQGLENKFGIIKGRIKTFADFDKEF